MSVVQREREHQQAIRVLYVHHAAPFGGSARSLLELIESFPPATVQPLVLTRRGQFEEMLAAASIPVLGCRGVSQFDHTRYSHYRGWRWLVLLRELAYLPTTLLGLWAAKRQWGGVDLVHVNDVTLLPAVWLARRLFGCPLIVHVRSLQQPLRGWRGRLIFTLLHTQAQQLIAIDETVRSTLDPRLKTVVIHNGLRVAGDAQSPRATASARFTAGMVGGLSRAKGCLEFVEAAAWCREQGADIRFVFVGQSMRRRSPLRDFVLRRLGLSQEIEQELQARISALALADVVEFWPFATDLEQIYRQFDVVCFPSHLDAPGRPIFEAAFFGVPSIAAVTTPLGDTLVDGVTGLAVRPRAPRQLAEAILFMYANPEQRAAMGRQAADLAKTHFDASANAAQVLAVYRQVIAATVAGERA